ncbi:MAG: zinc-binding dehydrogenase [Anaerolineae bacterium]
MAPLRRGSIQAVDAEMWAVVADEPGDLGEVRVPRPVRGSDEVLVRVVAAGIAAHALRSPAGGHSSAGPENTWPAVALVGTVEEAGPEHVALVGRPVAVVPSVAGDLQLTGVVMPEWLSVPADAILALPAGRPLEEATLLGATAGTLRAVRQASIQIGESVAILGTDLVSVLAAQWVRIAGAYDVYIVDRDARGLALARTLWLGERIDAGGESAASTVRAQHSGRGVDLAIVPAGDDQRLRLATELVEPGGRVLVLSAWAPAGQVTRLSAPENDSVRLNVASTAAECATRFDWEVAARTWASGRLALRDLIAERVSVNAFVARTNAGRLGHEGFMVVVTQDRD